MRYKNFLDDAGYLKETAKLLQERPSLEEKRKRLRNGETKLYPLFEKVIYVAYYASFWFKKASEDDKRLLIETIGSNPVLQEQKLLIQAQLPFAFLQNLKNTYSGYFGKFEPSNSGQPKTKRRPLGPSCSVLLAQVDDVRTFWENNIAWKDRLSVLLERFGDKME